MRIRNLCPVKKIDFFVELSFFLLTWFTENGTVNHISITEFIYHNGTCVHMAQTIAIAKPRPPESADKD